MQSSMYIPDSAEETDEIDLIVLERRTPTPFKAEAPPMDVYGQATPRPPKTNGYKDPPGSTIEIILDASPRPPLPLKPDPYESDDLPEPVVSDISGQPWPRIQMVPLNAKQPAVATSAKAESRPALLPTQQKRKPGRPKGSGKQSRSSPSAERPTRTRPTRRVAKPKEKAGPEEILDQDFPLKKKRGRSQKVYESTLRAIYENLNPEFIPFSCDWEGCPAELHNMDTLRRHIAIVHGKRRECRWGECATENPPVRLAGDREFKEHMEAAHLTSYEWHMGDGCRIAVTGLPHDSENIPQYLLDEDGNQVTPSIKDQQLENHATYLANLRRLRRLFAERDANAPLASEFYEN